LNNSCLVQGALTHLVAPETGKSVQWQGRGAILLSAPDKTLLARLDFVTAVLGTSPVEVTLQVDGGVKHMRAYGYDGAETLREATLQVEEIAGYFGNQSVEETRSRLPMIRARAASCARGETDPAPATLRWDWGRDAVHVSRHTRPWTGFFTVEESDLSFRRFDGAMSPQISRAGFVSGDAAIVLPYDAKRDLVLLIEQFRFGPFLRHDTHPWLLEPIAGKVDAGETPENAAHREAREEAGLEIDRLELVSANYPSPGANSEFFYTYIGLCDLDPAMQGVGGLADEHEDIKSHVIPFARLLELLSSGEVNCGPLVLLALWVQLNRSRLRARA